jgi:hypothetical protein
MRKEGGIFVDIGVVGYGGALELGVRPAAGGTGFLVTILIWQIEVADWRVRLALKLQMDLRTAPDQTRVFVVPRWFESCRLRN